MHRVSSLGPLVRAALLLTALAGSGCVSEHDAWSFGLTRALYSDVDDGTTTGDAERHAEYLAGRDAEGAGGAALFVVLLAIPLAADIVMLPVTGAHDLLLPVVGPLVGDEDASVPLRPTPPPAREP